MDAPVLFNEISQTGTHKQGTQSLSFKKEKCTHKEMFQSETQLLGHFGNKAGPAMPLTVVPRLDWFLGSACSPTSTALNKGLN